MLSLRRIASLSYFAPAVYQELLLPAQKNIFEICDIPTEAADIITIIPQLYLKLKGSPQHNIDDSFNLKLLPLSKLICNNLLLS